MIIGGWLEVESSTVERSLIFHTAYFPDSFYRLHKVCTVDQAR